jgi:hypothetical protein
MESSIAHNSPLYSNSDTIQVDDELPFSPLIFDIYDITHPHAILFNNLL